MVVSSHVGGGPRMPVMFPRSQRDLELELGAETPAVLEHRIAPPRARLYIRSPTLARGPVFGANYTAR